MISKQPGSKHYGSPNSQEKETVATKRIQKQKNKHGINVIGDLGEIATTEDYGELTISQQINKTYTL